jgi:DNA repair protein RecN (Recombination protein N)
MERELGDLNMQRARFQVQIERVPDPDGVCVDGECVAFTATGIDRVEFLIAPNPGEPLKPLARIASGGETSRLMLALKTILARADPVPILIFDEIDAGISGRSGQVVGEKLWNLGRGHQVLCVTHLPQIAALGDCHFSVAKDVEGDRTRTHVVELTAEQRTEELGQMLGGARTRASRANAGDLLQRASLWKRQHAAESLPA